VAEDEEHVTVWISVGVGGYDGQTSPEDITSRSDEALYSAKQAGKEHGADFPEFAAKMMKQLRASGHMRNRDDQRDTAMSG
jgi:GGDEF domain-containing protein